jgi:hypothetical protein
MEIEGRTTIRGNHYIAEFNPAGVEIKRKATAVFYSWRDVSDIVALVESPDRPIAFGNASRQPETLESLLRIGS